MSVGRLAISDSAPCTPQATLYWPLSEDQAEHDRALVVGLGEDQRPEEVVPDPGELQRRQHGQRRQAERQRHLGQHLPFVGALRGSPPRAGRSARWRRSCASAACRSGCPAPMWTMIIGHSVSSRPKRVEQAEQRNEDDLRREEHARRRCTRNSRLLPAERQLGEDVAGQDAERDRADGRRHRHQQRVDQVGVDRRIGEHLDDSCRDRARPAATTDCPAKSPASILSDDSSTPTVGARNSSASTIRLTKIAACQGSKSPRAGADGAALSHRSRPLS